MLKKTLMIVLVEFPEGISFREIMVKTGEISRGLGVTPNCSGARGNSTTLEANNKQGVKSLEEFLRSKGRKFRAVGYKLRSL
jgi:hypothetical protein